MRSPGPNQVGSTALNENAGGCMSNRRRTAAIGVLWAAFALAASPPRQAAAQAGSIKTDTAKKARVDTSAKRIKIKKDTTVKTAGGEVCLPGECVTAELV